VDLLVKNQYVSIAGRKVGKGYPCFIIAEAGVNHNGSVEIAKKLVDAASEAGADAIKFQTFKAEELATKEVGKAQYQKGGHEGSENQLEMLKKLELSEDDFEILSGYCMEKGIIFLSTPFDFQSSDFLERVDVPAFKVSSGDLNNYPFLAHMAKKGKPMILSTGMADLDEIREAISSITAQKNDDIIILQCTSAYPAPFHEVNLNVMRTLATKFGLPTGFSDHTIGIEVSIAAVALGACLVEKHFTLDKSMEGPDHKASIEPYELKRLVGSVRNVEAALGSSEKVVMASERGTRQVSRKRIVAGRDLNPGETLTPESLALKRSSKGLDPSFFEKLIGKKLKRALKKDEAIKIEYLEE
jgi:N-acetylneuraminate synthase